MSIFGNNNPVTSSFRDYSPGPHAGVDSDPDSQVAPDTTDSRARNALTLGILSLFFGFLTGIPAIWVGRKALRHLDDIGAGGAARSRRMAWAGIVLGCVGVAATVALWVYLRQ